MYDQVYRYLDLPGQVCDNIADISTHCVAAHCLVSPQLCVCMSVYASAWETVSALVSDKMRTNLFFTTTSSVCISV